MTVSMSGETDQAVDAFVVSDVDDHGQIDLGDGRQSPGQTGAAHPSRQHRQPHVILPRLRYSPDRNTMSCPMTSPPGLPVAPSPAMTPGVSRRGGCGAVVTTKPPRRDHGRRRPASLRTRSGPSGWRRPVRPESPSRRSPRPISPHRGDQPSSTTSARSSTGSTTRSNSSG